MRSFIQLTDTDNDILRSLPLGDLSSTTTYSFRVWNNYSQAAGIAALDGLELKMFYPPKQGIQTLINEDTIKVRCTYSGKHSEAITSGFQTFPLSGDTYDRLEPNTYNEYEVQIDFSNLSNDQKASINNIAMEFNIVASWDEEYIPLSLPGYRYILSDTVILVPDKVLMSLVADTRVLNSYKITKTTDSTIV